MTSSFTNQARVCFLLTKRTRGGWFGEKGGEFSHVWCALLTCNGGSTSPLLSLILRRCDALVNEVALHLSFLPSIRFAICITLA